MRINPNKVVRVTERNGNNENTVCVVFNYTITSKTVRRFEDILRFTKALYSDDGFNTANYINEALKQVKREEPYLTAATSIPSMGDIEAKWSAVF